MRGSALALRNDRRKPETAGKRTGRRKPPPVGRFVGASACRGGRTLDRMQCGLGASLHLHGGKLRGDYIGEMVMSGDDVYVLFVETAECDAVLQCDHVALHLMHGIVAEACRGFWHSRRRPQYAARQHCTTERTDELSSANVSRPLQEYLGHEKPSDAGILQTVGDAFGSLACPIGLGRTAQRSRFRSRERANLQIFVTGT